MVRDPSPTTGSSSAATRSAASRRDKTSRWRLSGLVVDWRDYDRIYDEAGLIPPKDHTPIQDEYYVYDDDLNQLGYATSQMYSPMLQRTSPSPASRSTGPRPARGSSSSWRSATATSTSTPGGPHPLFNPERRTA